MKLTETEIYAEYYDNNKEEVLKDIKLDVSESDTVRDLYDQAVDLYVADIQGTGISDLTVYESDDEHRTYSIIYKDKDGKEQDITVGVIGDYGNEWCTLYNGNTNEI